MMGWDSRKAIRVFVFLGLLLALLGLTLGPVTSGAARAAHDDNALPEEGEPTFKDIEEHKESFNVAHLMEHVLGAEKVDLFTSFGPSHIDLPLGIHKFVLLEFLAAGLVLLFYIPLAMRASSGTPPRGAIGNAFEVLLTFVRNDIAKPTIGEDADKYVPFLWTLFLFILFNNLLGMFPFLGSPTASIWVTFALAIIVFFAIHGAAIMKMSANGHGHGHDHGHGESPSPQPLAPEGRGAHEHGEHADHHHGEPAAAGGGKLARGFKNYMHSMWPQLDLPFPFGPIIKPLVFVLEIIGVLVRNMVLAIRLFANMFAGHMVLATILLFIQMAAGLGMIWLTVTVSSVVGIVALSLLELFVAFLQAFIFTFLTSLFMGMALNPQH
jgi:F-type H+-transporting ATPase subunit a